MEERAEGREKAEESEARGELGVEVSAEGLKGPLVLPTETCSQPLGFPPAISAAPEENAGAVFVIMASKEGPKENDVSRKTTGTTSSK